MAFLAVSQEFEGACCENLSIKSLSPDFHLRECIGHFNLYLDVEDEPFVCYGASVFKNNENKTYLYRSKYGTWIIGKTLGKVKKGALIRSHDDEKDKFALVCPCGVEKWQARNGESWKNDDSIRIMIRRNKKVF
eukprot:GFUD01022047.1.p1 GENE.GFUD01022047.1~~GFUD01022047.1.p1  ORF type:complete len:134 (+),score=26.97 GFUD01022047.1:36-437(+)